MRRVLTLDWKSFIPYELIFVLCGVFLMRQLRLNQQFSAKGNIVNLVSISFIILIGVILLWITKAVIDDSDSLLSIIEVPFTLIIYVITIIIQLLLWIFDSIINLIFGNHQFSPPELAPPNLRDDELDGINPFTTSTGNNLWLIILISLVLIIVLYKVVGNIKPATKKVSTLTDDYDIIEPPPKVRQKRKLSPLKSNRDKVRSIYRKYLKQIQKDYGNYSKSKTSMEIHEMNFSESSPESITDASLELRKVYLAARYNEDKNISSADVKNAKESLNKLKDPRN